MLNPKILFIAKYSVKDVENTTIEFAANYLKDKKIIGLDIETSRKYDVGVYNEEIYKGGLDPYLSRVILIQIGTLDHVFVIDARQFSKEELAPIFDIIHYKKDITIVGQNLKFEGKHLHHNYGLRFYNVWDTMIAEMVLTNGLGLKFGLADLAGRYLGIQKQKDSVLFSEYEEKAQITIDETLLAENKHLITPFEVEEAREIDKSTRLQFINIGDRPFTYDQVMYGADDVILPLLIMERQLLGRRLHNDEVYLPIKCIKLENSFTQVLADMELEGMLVDKKIWLDIARSSELEYYTRKIELDCYVTSLYPTMTGQQNLFGSVPDYLLQTYPELEEVVAKFPSTLECMVQWSSPDQTAKFLKKLNLCPRAFSKQTKSEEWTAGAKELVKKLPMDMRGKYDKNRWVSFERKEDGTFIEDHNKLILAIINLSKSHQAMTTFGKDWLKYIHPITNKIHSSFRQILNTGRMSSTNPNCFSIDTKLLTKQGWKDFEHISVGDKILTFNTETRVLEEQVVESFYLGKGAAIEFAGSDVFNGKMTLDHRQVVLDNTNEIVIKPALDVTSEDRVINAAILYEGDKADEDFISKVCDQAIRKRSFKEKFISKDTYLFSWDLLKLDYNSRLDIVTRLLIVPRKFITKRKENISILQTLAFTVGVASKVEDPYKLVLLDSSVNELTGLSTNIYDKKVLVWCVKVANGTVIAKRNDIMWVSGNCQQLPKGVWRTPFVVAEGESMICADFSNQELRTLADKAEETNMLNFFIKGDPIFGTDLHSYSATRIARLTTGDPNALIPRKELDNGDDNPEFLPEHNDLRNKSKCVDKNTIIVTNYGVARIGDLHKGREADTFYDINVKVASEGNFVTANKFYSNSVGETMLLITEHDILRCSKRHQIVLEDGELEQAQYITENCIVANCDFDFLGFEYVKNSLLHITKESEVDNLTIEGRIAYITGRDIREGRKNRVAKVPIWILNSGIDNKQAFLSGLVGDEGYVSVSQDNKLNFYTKDIQIASDIVFILKTLRVSYKINIDNTSEEEYPPLTIEVNIGESPNFSSSKVQLCKQVKNRYLCDISVDSEDHLYLSGTLLNHNTTSFGIAYGKGIRGFSEDFGCSEEEAEVFINGYLDAFPKLREYFKKVQEKSLADGFITIDSKSDRRWFSPLFQRVNELYTEGMKVYSTPEYKSLSPEERIVFKEKFKAENPWFKELWREWNALRGSLSRKSLNYPIQGCIPATSLILTPTGYKKIGDFTFGNVWTGSEWANARKIYTGEAPKIELILSNGSTFVCDIRHKMLVNEDGNKVWCHVKDILGKELVQPDETATDWGSHRISLPIIVELTNSIREYNFVSIAVISSIPLLECNYTERSAFINSLFKTKNDIKGTYKGLCILGKVINSVGKYYTITSDSKGNNILTISDEKKPIYVTHVIDLNVSEPMYTLTVDNEKHCFTNEGFISKNTSASQSKLAGVMFRHNCIQGNLPLALCNMVHDEMLAVSRDQSRNTEFAKLLSKCMCDGGDYFCKVDKLMGASPKVGDHWLH